MAGKKTSPTTAAAVGETIAVDGKTVKVKFGGFIPDMGKAYTKEELLNDAEAVAYLLEIGSGLVEIVEPTNEN